jgi:hypothetical protein
VEHPLVFVRLRPIRLDNRQLRGITPFVSRKSRSCIVARPPALEIEATVAEAVRAASPASNQQGRRELHQPRASGHGASTDPPAVRPSGYDATLRAAI